MSPNYQIFPLDLSVPRSAPGEKIVEAGNKVESVTVLGLPASGASIALGANRPLIPLTTQGMTFSLCPAADEGIFVSNAAGGGILLLFVAYADVGVVTS